MNNSINKDVSKQGVTHHYLPNKCCYSGDMTKITNILIGRDIKEWTVELGRLLEKQKEDMIQNCYDCLPCQF